MLARIRRTLDLDKLDWPLWHLHPSARLYSQTFRHFERETGGTSFFFLSFYLRKALSRRRVTGWSCEPFSFRRVPQRDESRCDNPRLTRPTISFPPDILRLRGSGAMSYNINPRGQKRKPEDGQGPSGHPDKRPREENGPSNDPNGELYWVVQWCARVEIVIFQRFCIHRCLLGDHPSTRNTRPGTGMGCWLFGD